MTSIMIHPPHEQRDLQTTGIRKSTSPLPKLLRTPAGMALIEIQGTINHPQASAEATNSISIGKLEFPDYKASDSSLADDGSGSWQKRVWLYIGDHQRLTGEVKKLPKPFGILRRTAKGKATQVDGMEGFETTNGGEAEELEIAEIVRWKIVFSSRPEPVGVTTDI